MPKRFEQDALFAQSETQDFTPTSDAPLAERCRPRCLEDYVGQQQILGEDRPLRRAIELDRVPSMILWGPPGSGKTTLARLIAGSTRAHFDSLSATHSGAKEFRKLVEAARMARRNEGAKTILFIDEIHRWNKSQQDGLLPHVESGLIILIGATTENPSFEVIGALLSRCVVYTLEPLQPDELAAVLRQGVETLRKEGRVVELMEEAAFAIAAASHGDARVALNALEQMSIYLEGDGDAVRLDAETVARLLQDKRLLYDKSGEEHYNLISALHKSMRGSDPQATLYWLARMMESGEDPLYIARRIIRFASEDVGLADPNGLLLAIAARDAYHMLGSPEGDLALAQAAVYLATAPKSNALYSAYGEALAAARKHGYLPAPLHIRNAPTRLMKDFGYGKEYRYAHDFEGAYTAQTYLPDALKDAVFYRPTDRGTEKKIKDRMDEWRRLAEREKKNRK